MKSGLAVEVKILAGIKDVKAPYPASDRRGKKQDAGIERAAHSEPRGSRSDAQRETKHQMRPARDALGIGIKKNYGKSDGRETQREAIQLRCGEDENAARYHDERCYESGRKMSRRNGTGAGAWVGGVDGCIGQAVEGHGGGARRDHGDHDPRELTDGRYASSCEHRAAESEGERENGVLPLDHFQGQTQAAKYGHKKILMHRWT